MNNRTSAKRIVSAGLAALAITAALVPNAEAQPARPRLTMAQIAAMDAPQQNRLLDPLRAVANAADQAGKSTEAAIYSTLRIDAPNDTVDVYLTDTSKKEEFLQTTHRIDPHIDTHLITVQKAPYTLRQLHSARAQLLAQQDAHKLPYTIYAAAVATDGTSLQVTVDKPDTARSATRSRENAATAGPARPLDTVAGVAVTFQSGQQPKATSWADTKWHDHAPFIGGDALVDGTYVCTAGLPTVRTSDNHPILITANHCFTAGDMIYTGGSPTPTMGNFYNTNGGYPGNFVGKVTGKSQIWDAEEIDGTNNNADESDWNTYHAVTSAAYSHTGDMVCQDGVASFFMRQGTVCGIQTINQDVTFVLDAGAQGKYNVRGVEGTRLEGNNPWAVAHGDSGGMVFTQGSSLQARGIVSAQTEDTAGANGEAGQYIYWTEAPDILGHFGLKLNPTT